MILLTGFKGDSIETGIGQRSSRAVDIQDCIVRVVRMDRVGGFYRKGSFLPFQAPRVGTVPVLISFPVGRGVFEVPVLNQFGIQAAIGGVVDVLKKDTDQFVANLLRPACIYLDRGFKRF